MEQRKISSTRVPTTKFPMLQENRLDELAQTLARGVSRRRALRLLAGYMTGSMLTFLGVGRDSKGGVNIGMTGALADEAASPDIRPTTVELLPYQSSGYRYQVIPLEVAPPAGWELPAFDDSGFQAGAAAFGSGGGCPLQSTVQTSWPAGSQLLVRAVLPIAGIETGLRIMVAVDNDIQSIFFDGQPLTNPISHDNCPVADEFRFDVPTQREGNKLLAFHILDRGIESFFDARILAEMPVHEAAPQCSGTNTVTVPCNQLNDYVRTCGVICPDGEVLKGAGGCTRFDFHEELAVPLRSLSITYQENFLGQLCASTAVTVTWVTDRLESSILHLDLPACCPDRCAKATSEAERQLELHEAGHRTRITNAIANANSEWANKRFSACASGVTVNPFGEVAPALKRLRARRALVAKIIAALRETRASIQNQIKQEPPQAMPVQCSECVEPKAGRRCLNGNCVEDPCRESSRCPTAVDCSQRGKSCLCARAAEGDLRCGASNPPGFCPGATRCVTTAACEGMFGPGWFCQESGTGCCGCAPDPSTDQVTCRDVGICLPSC
jgi:hypothetical protein